MSTNHTLIINEYIKKNTLSEQAGSRSEFKGELPQRQQTEKSESYFVFEREWENSIKSSVFSELMKHASYIKKVAEIILKQAGYVDAKKYKIEGSFIKRTPDNWVYSLQPSVGSADPASHAVVRALYLASIEAANHKEYIDSWKEYLKKVAKIINDHFEDAPTKLHVRSLYKGHPGSKPEKDYNFLGSKYRLNFEWMFRDSNPTALKARSADGERGQKIRSPGKFKKGKDWKTFKSELSAAARARVGSFRYTIGDDVTRAVKKQSGKGGSLLSPINVKAQDNYGADASYTRAKVINGRTLNIELKIRDTYSRQGHLVRPKGPKQDDPKRPAKYPGASKHEFFDPAKASIAGKIPMEKRDYDWLISDGNAYDKKAIEAFNEEVIQEQMPDPEGMTVKQIGILNELKRYQKSLREAWSNTGASVFFDVTDPFKQNIFPDVVSGSSTEKKAAVKRIQAGMGVKQWVVDNIMVETGELGKLMAEIILLKREIHELVVLNVKKKLKVYQRENGKYFTDDNHKIKFNLELYDALRDKIFNQKQKLIKLQYRERLAEGEKIAKLNAFISFLEEQKKEADPLYFPKGSRKVPALADAGTTSARWKAGLSPRHYKFGSKIKNFTMFIKADGGNNIPGKQVPVINTKSGKQIGAINVTRTKGVVHLNYIVGADSKIQMSAGKKGTVSYKDTGLKKNQLSNFVKVRQKAWKDSLRSLFKDAADQKIIGKNLLKVLNQDLDAKRGLATLPDALEIQGKPFFDTARSSQLAAAEKTAKDPEVSVKPKIRTDSTGTVRKFQDKSEFTKYRKAQTRALANVSKKLTGSKNKLNIETIVKLLINGRVDTNEQQNDKKAELDLFRDIKNDNEKYYTFKSITEQFQSWLAGKGFLARKTAKGNNNIDGIFGKGTMSALEDVVKINDTIGAKYSAKDWLKSANGNINIEKAVENASIYSSKMYKKAGLDATDVAVKFRSDLAKYEVISSTDLAKTGKYHVKNKEGDWVFKKLNDEQKSAFRKDFETRYAKKLTAVAKKLTDTKKEQFDKYIQTREIINRNVEDEAKKAAEEKAAAEKEKEKKSPINLLRNFASRMVIDERFKGAVTDMINKLLPNFKQELEKLITEDNILKLFDLYIKYTGKESPPGDHPLADRYQNRPPQKDKESEVESIRAFFNTEQETKQFLKFLSRPSVLLKTVNFDIFGEMEKRGSSKYVKPGGTFFFSKFLHDQNNNELYKGVIVDIKSAFNNYKQLGKRRQIQAKTMMASALIRFTQKHNVADIKSILEKVKNEFSKIDGDYLDKILRDNSVKLASIPLGTWIAKLVRRGHLIPNPKTGRYEWSDELKDPAARAKVGYAGGKLAEENLNPVLNTINSIIQRSFVDKNLKIQFHNEKITENVEFLNYFEKNKDPLEDLIEVFSLEKVIKEEIINLFNFSEAKRVFSNFFPESYDQFNKQSHKLVENKLTIIKENGKFISKSLYNTIMNTILDRINDFLIERAA